MQELWLTQLVFVIFNISLLVFFVMANGDFCGSVFETQVDFALLGHVMNKSDHADEFECRLKCMGNNGCKSFNVHPGGNSSNRISCELNNKTRQMNPGDLKLKKGSTYYGSVQATCVDVSHAREGQTRSGQCHPGYKGTRCQIQKLGSFSSSPAHSCKDIRDSGDSKGDGEYWIDPEKSGNALKVFCDMTTDGGGWLLVFNFVIDDPSKLVQLVEETSYRGVTNHHSNKMALKSSAMNELRSRIHFTQLRFYCSKQQGRTFHVTTAANNTGEAVVEYFSRQRDVLPNSCKSFHRMGDDNSKLAEQCEEWGFNGSSRVGKWGHSHVKGQDRLYNRPALIYQTRRWALESNGKLHCDDDDDDPSNFPALSPGDFWKIYVR